MDEISVLAVSLVVLLIYLSNRLYRGLRIDLAKPKEYYNILITGCDTGIGNRTAKRFHKLGHEVIACCLTQKGVDELSSIGIKCYLLDITNRESIEYVFEKVAAAYPEGLWALINNAGIGQNSFFEMTTLDKYKKIMEVNFHGTLSVIQTFLPLLKKKEGSRLVIMSSLSAIAPVPGHSAYSASKAALYNMSTCLAVEMKRWKIQVVNIVPGGIDTELIEKNLTILQQSWENAPDDIKKKYGDNWLTDQVSLLNKVPMKRVLGSAEQVVDAYVHACLAKYPKRMYVILSALTLIHWVNCYLPFFISDWVTQKINLGV